MKKKLFGFRQTDTICFVFFWTRDVDWARVDIVWSGVKGRHVHLCPKKMKTKTKRKKKDKKYRKINKERKENE